MVKKLLNINISVHFVWFDFWIGCYYNVNKKVLYICPIPMVVFRISGKKERDNFP